MLTFVSAGLMQHGHFPHPYSFGMCVVRPKQGSIGYFDSGGGSNDERLEVCFIIFKENT